MNQLKKVGIKDIAKAMDLSPAAVSYALTGKGRVSKKTRLEVERVAREMGFIRDDTAVRLRTGRSRLLGAVVNDMSNTFIAELLQSFERTANEAGYLTIVANTRDDLGIQQSMVHALLSQGVAGLMISPAHGTDASQLEVIGARECPYVVCVREIGGAASYVGLDERKAGEIAAGHLVDTGNPGFAFVGGFTDTSTYVSRLEGVRKAAKRGGVPLDDGMVSPCAPTAAAAEYTVARLLERHPGCDAILAYNDQVAIGAYAALQAAGRRIGEDFSVVGMDNVGICSALMPPLTTVDMHASEIGRRTSKELLASLDQGLDTAAGRPARPEVSVRPELVERRSVVRR